MAAGEQSSPSNFQMLRLCLTCAAGSLEARERRLIVFAALGFSSATLGNSASLQLVSNGGEIDRRVLAHPSLRDVR